MQARFQSRCQACGCQILVGEDIDYTRGIGARHYLVNQCAAAKRLRAEADQAQAAAASKLDLSSIVKFIQAARDRGLKFPKLRVLSTDGRTELRIGLTARGQAPGSIAVKSEDDFLGCVRPNGHVVGKLASSLLLQAHLVKIAEDPAAAAKQYAALMCRCSFCGLALTDAGSVEVGYGPVCAKHWGLPHHPLGKSLLVAVPGTPQQLPLSGKVV